ncbi:MAG: winged helix-turn-helix transcriptional regulator [Halobacteriales archaeon]
MTNDNEPDTELPESLPRPDPMAAILPIVGRKWHPVIVHRLLVNGPQGFNDLNRSIEGISPKVLSNCLDDLQDKGILNRRIVSEKPVRIQYALTERGESLESVITAMERWANDRITRTNSRDEAVVSVPR